MAGAWGYRDRVGRGDASDRRTLPARRAQRRGFPLTEADPSFATDRDWPDLLTDTEFQFRIGFSIIAYHKQEAKNEKMG